MSAPFTRAQRQQMQKAADAVDRVSQADRRFFERFPRRQHRVRLASRAELEQFAITLGIADISAPHGFEHYVVVKNIADGVRLRRPLTAPAGNDTDVSEAEARWLYDSTLTDRQRQIEAQMRKAAEARS